MRMNTLRKNLARPGREELDAVTRERPGSSPLPAVRHVPPAGWKVVEPHQEHLLAFAVPRDLQQFFDALETRFPGQIAGELIRFHRLDRVHDDVAVVHAVAATHLDMRAGPDANGAPDPPAPDSLTKTSGELHTSSESHRNLERIRGGQR